MEERKKHNELADFFRRYPMVTQKELARLLGVTPSWVSMLVTGRRPVPKTLIYAIGNRQLLRDLKSQYWEQA
jgi:DNA-binding transcriptional regulator YdaS (Cro superfamily)